MASNQHQIKNHNQNSNNSFKIKQLPTEFHVTEKEMENDVREHLNLAHYNFNRMAVIDEEGIENQGNTNNIGSR